MTRPLTDQDALSALDLIRSADPTLSPCAVAFLAAASLAEPDADPVPVPHDIDQGTITHAAERGARAVCSDNTRIFAIGHLVNYTATGLSLDPHTFLKHLRDVSFPDRS